MIKNFVRLNMLNPEFWPKQVNVTPLIRLGQNFYKFIWVLNKMGGVFPRLLCALKQKYSQMSAFSQNDSMSLKPRLNFFTLVELLIVISVLSILVSLLQPSLKKALGKSKQLECMKIMNVYATASQMYIQDFDYVINGQVNIPAGYYSSVPTVRDYFGLQPHEAGGAKTTSNGTDTNKNTNDSLDPSHSTYTLNTAWGFIPKRLQCPENNEPSCIGKNVVGHFSTGTRSGAIIRPNITFEWMDAANGPFLGSWLDYPLSAYDTWLNRANFSMNMFPAFRHLEGTNLVFFDGHVEYRKWEDVVSFSGTPATNPNLLRLWDFR